MAMTVTATMSGVTPLEHIYLWVRVLLNATEAGGQNSHGIAASGGSSAGATIVPNATNSLILFALSSDNPGNAAFTALTNNTISSTGLDSDDWLYGFGLWASTVTAGTGVAYGGSPISSDYDTWAAYEYLASAGSTPTVDASSPALATSTSKTVTSASFTPPAGSVIHVGVVGGGSGSSGTFLMAVSGGSLTWTQRAGSSPVTDQSSFVFSATVPGGGGGGPVARSNPSLMQAVNRAANY